MDRRDVLKGLLAVPAAVVVACVTKRQAEPVGDPLPYCDCHDPPAPLDSHVEDPALLHHGARFGESQQDETDEWFARVFFEEYCRG